MWLNECQPVASFVHHATVTLRDFAVTLAEYYCYSVVCVAECLLTNCVVVLGFVAVAIVAYLVVHSFVAIALTYFVAIFVDFADCCDGSDLNCSLLDWTEQG